MSVQNTHTNYKGPNSKQEKRSVGMGKLVERPWVYRAEPITNVNSPNYSAAFIVFVGRGELVPCAWSVFRTRCSTSYYM
jgi:hypothetical protein